MVAARKAMGVTAADLQTLDQQVQALLRKNFRALVQVSSSTYAPCHVGATGTLIVSTNTQTASLQVCHRNLIQGTGSTNAHISN